MWWNQFSFFDFILQSIPVCIWHVISEIFVLSQNYYLLLCQNKTCWREWRFYYFKIISPITFGILNWAFFSFKIMKKYQSNFGSFLPLHFLIQSGTTSHIKCYISNQVIVCLLHKFKISTFVTIFKFCNKIGSIFITIVFNFDSHVESHLSFCQLK